MGQTPGGITYPDSEKQAGDPEFWKAHALSLQTKLGELNARLREAERVARDASKQAEGIEAVARRLTTLERRPEPEPVDLTPLEKRIAALEGREQPADPTERLDRMRLHIRQLQALNGLSEAQLSKED